VSLSITLGLSAVSGRESRLIFLGVNLLDHPLMMGDLCSGLSGIIFMH
jgi:hypothetical protein